MDCEEIDRLWMQAMRDSVEAGELYVRHRFAALVAEAEREACAALCDDMAQSGFLDPMEVYRATFIADAIRARGES